MKTAIYIVLALAAAAFIGVALNGDNGYALFNYRGTSVEMSLVTLAFFLIGSFVLLYLLIRLAIGLRGLYRGAGTQRRLRLRTRANRRLIDGLIDVAEGRWEKGEKQIVRAADASDVALLNYLIAARAAQLQGAHERRDNYLSRAYELSDKARMAVLLTQAELQIAHHQFELALATLRRIQELHPDHDYALRLLARLYSALNDQEQLHALMPTLRKRQVLPAAQLDEMELATAVALMNTAAMRRDVAALTALWDGSDKRLRRSAPAVRGYAAALIAADAHQQADQLIRSELKSRWDDGLAGLFGAVKTDEPSRQLAQAENWLAQHGDSAPLLLSLGRLAIACGLWGKAKSYLETSAKRGGGSDAYAELGRLLESLGEAQAAAAAYRAALTPMIDAPLTPLSIHEKA